MKVITIYDFALDKAYYIGIEKRDTCMLGSNDTHKITVSNGQPYYEDVLIFGSYLKCYNNFKKILMCDEHEIVETIRKISYKNKLSQDLIINNLLKAGEINFKYN